MKIGELFAEIDADTKGFDKGLRQSKKELNTFSSAITRVTNLIGAKFVLAGAAAVGGITPATAALGAMSSAAASAGAGIGAFATSAVGNMAKVTEALDEGAKAMSALTPAQKELARSVRALTAEYDAFLAATAQPVGDALQQWIDFASEGLTELAPITVTAAAAIEQLGHQARSALGSPFWQDFFDFLATTAQPMLMSFGRVLGNVARGSASLLMAFAPMARDVTAGLESMTAAFARWAAGLAGSEGFAQFQRLAREVGPQLLETLEALSAAFLELVAAVGPLATPLLHVVEAAAELVNGLDSITFGLSNTAVQVAAAYFAFRKLGGFAMTAGGKLGVLALNLQDTGRAGRRASRGIHRVGSALSRAGAVAGTAVAAYVAVKAAVEGLENVLHGTPATVTNLQAALVALGQQGRLTGQQASALGVDMAELRKAIKTVGQGAPQTANTFWLLGKATAALGLTNDAAAERVDRLDRTLAGMVDGGSVTKARAAIRELGLTTEQVKNLLPEYTAALARNNIQLGKTGREARDAASGLTTITQAEIRGLIETTNYKTALSLLTDELNTQKIALEQVWRAQRTLTVARRKAAQTEINYEAQLDATNKELAEGTITLNVNTEAGRANKQAILDLIRTGDEHIATLIRQGKSVAEVTAESKEHEAQLRRVMEQAGFTDQQIDTYIATLFSTPAEIATRIEGDTRAATRNIREFRRDANAALNGIDNEAVKVWFEPVMGAINAAFDKVLPRASGGSVFGPGTGTSDSIPAMLSNGEFVVRESVASRARGFLSALNAGQGEALQAAGVTPYAQGGPVDGRPHPNQPGPAWATGAPIGDVASLIFHALGDFSGVDDHINSVISRSIPDIVVEVPAGGARAIQFSRAHEGDPYVWGGVGPHGFDCSGWLSAVTNVIRGETNPYFRLGSTATFPWGGFTSGWGRILTIGSSPSVSGGVGHMAGTILPQRFNTESDGGGGVKAGGNATGAGAGIFFEHGHEFDNGGLLGDLGWFFKNTQQPERVLSPRMTEQFGRLVDWLDDGGLFGWVDDLVDRVMREFDARVPDQPAPSPPPAPRDRPPVHNEVHVYNPTPEMASDSVQARLARMSALGLFQG